MLGRVVLSAGLMCLATMAHATVIIDPNAALHGAAGPAGLNGTFYKAGAGSTNFDIADTLSAMASTPASGTFRATALNYAGGDGSTITSFLGSDGASYKGRSAAFDLSDGILDMSGYLFVGSAGTYTFALSHDDSAQLRIAGQTVISSNCCGTDTNTVNFGTSGYYAIDVVYSNTYYGGGVGGANFALTDNGSVLTSASLSTSVPEPATLALMSVGLLGTALARRRRAGAASA